MKFSKITEDQIINKHKDASLLNKTLNNEDILGEEVDDNNQLVYVLKKNNQTYLKKALECDVETSPKPVGIKFPVKIKKQ